MKYKMSKYITIDDTKESIKIWNRQVARDYEIFKIQDDFLDSAEMTTVDCISSMIFVPKGEITILIDGDAIELKTYHSIIIIGEQKFSFENATTDVVVEFISDDKVI